MAILNLQIQSIFYQNANDIFHSHKINKPKVFKEPNKTQ